MDDDIKIENRKYYLLKIYFFIDQLEEITEKNFFIELKDEEDKIISNNNKISKEKKNKFANILCDINVLKNFFKRKKK